MYNSVPRKRERLIRTSGNIDLGLPDPGFMKFRSVPVDIDYRLKRQHCGDIELFDCDVVAADGMLIFQDVQYRSAVHGYPPEVMDILCRMVFEEMERYCIVGNHDCIMITTDIPLFPEIFLERKYEISDYRFLHVPGWQGVKELIP